MIRNRDYYYPSPWMRADDLPVEGGDFTITGVDDEIVGRDEQLKPALGFKETEKRLLLNITQYTALIRLIGDDDVDKWAGTRVKLVPVTQTIKNKKAGTEEDIRTIRIEPASPLVASADSEKSNPTLKRKRDAMDESSARLVAATQKSPNNEGESPFTS